MRFAFALLGVLLLWPWSDLEAEEVYKSGRYTVRKVKDACKLEILLHNNEREPLAILALFPTDYYYGELFTEKKRIGKARHKMTIQFEQEEPRNVFFVKDASADDDYWRWQYLENSKGLLSHVSRKKNMTVSFSNGMSPFKYKVALKGSSNAVHALRLCHRAKKR